MRLKFYLHADKGEFAETVKEVMEDICDHPVELPDEIREKLFYAFCEVEIEVEVDPKTFDYKILSAKET